MKRTFNLKFPEDARSAAATEAAALRPKNPNRSRTSKWTGRTFLSPDGIPILVGRNRKENEFLSGFIAKVDAASWGKGWVSG
jgi:predicted ribosome quality control (RQC) complex YloA/Tae2 family protein